LLEIHREIDAIVRSDTAVPPFGRLRNRVLILKTCLFRLARVLNYLTAMVESSEDSILESAPTEGEETSMKPTKSSDQSSTVDGSISEMASSAPTEWSKDENKDEGDQTEATETRSKEESIGVGQDEATTTVKAGSIPPESSPKRANTKSGDTKKSKNGNSTNHGEIAQDEKGSTSGGDVNNKNENQVLAAGPVVSSSKKTRPAYKYDPDKVTLRFLFANKDGLTVTIECKPGDTVGEVKGQLLSVWPKGELCRNLSRSIPLSHRDNFNRTKLRDFAISSVTCRSPGLFWW
jgi:hypothetical protein